ncbi:MAG: SLC13 family permease [Oscillospiraceae bacterium]|nr:SLC13 family permease [Oscillospiraceae bacterium]
MDYQEYVEQQENMEYQTYVGYQDDTNYEEYTSGIGNVSALGVIVGILVGVILVMRKLNPICSLFLGVVAGALVGGASLANTLNIVLDGTSGIMGVVARIIAGGVLAGVLIESGGAESIARTIVKRFGEKYVLIGVALSSVIITGSGIFMSVGVVLLAPIALAVGSKTNVSKASLILALSGGAKAGNMIGPNPNTVAAAEGFGLSVSEVMINGIVPAIFGILITILLANMIKNRGVKVTNVDLEGNCGEDTKDLPSFGRAMVGPIAAILLLIISPIGAIFGIEFLSNFNIDAFFALPLAAAIGCIAMGRGKKLVSDANSGMIRMSPIVLMLLGAGAIAGLVRNSYLPDMLVEVIETMGLSTMFLGPMASSLMGAITGSTAAGAVLRSRYFCRSNNGLWCSIY